MRNEFVVTATRSMRSYAATVLEYLKKYPSIASNKSIDGINALEVKTFADGEMEVLVNTSLRGKDVFIFTTCARNDAGIGVNDARIELYHAIDALKRSRCEKIVIFEPYVSCARSDRPMNRSSVGLWIHFKSIVELGAEHIVTYQLHSDKSKAMLDPTLCLLDDLPALTLVKKYICDNHVKTMEKLENEVKNTWAFCSVDVGGEKLTQRFANAFGAPLVIAHKQRDYSKANTVESINILSSVPIEGKILWVVDDMIDTAGSISVLIEALTKLNPAEINVIAVHAPFSMPAEERIRSFIKRGILKRIIITDTVWCPPSITAEFPNLVVVHSEELSARVIHNIVTTTSLGDVHENFNAHNYLKNQGLFD